MQKHITPSSSRNTSTGVRPGPNSVIVHSMNVVSSAQLKVVAAAVAVAAAAAAFAAGAALTLGKTPTLCRATFPFEPPEAFDVLAAAGRYVSPPPSLEYSSSWLSLLESLCPAASMLLLLSRLWSSAETQPFFLWATGGTGSELLDRFDRASLPAESLTAGAQGGDWTTCADLVVCLSSTP